MDIHVFDIDGTLSRSIFQRREHSYPTKDSAMWVMDPCRVAQDEKILHVVNSGDEDPLIIILTGRAEWSRSITIGWLLEHGIPYDMLMMRQTADLRESHVVKRERLAHLKANPHINHITVWDDDPRVGEHCEELGIEFIFCGE